MKTIGIIGAMDVEMQLIREKINIIGMEVYAGFKFYLGKYENINLVMVTCGCGKVNAASCTQVLVDKFNVTDIINTGIAGSLNADVKICDIVISDNVTYHDVRQAQMIRQFPFKEFFEANEELKQIAVKAFENINSEKLNCHIGRIVTGEAFVSDNSLKEWIINNYNPCCVEMEGSAIGHVAWINNVPFLITRSISDNADNDASISYDEFEKIASNNSANLVLKMIELMSC